MLGNRIIIGIVPGVLIPQPDPSFEESEWGFDDGKRVFLTHPETSKSKWPKRDQADSEFKNMFVREVIPRDDESGLKELTVLYRGVMRFTNGIMKERILPACPVSMFTLPALSSGSPVRVIAPVPKPSVAREYLTLTKPTMNGVSQGISDKWVAGPLPGFSISFVPDPDQPQSINYGTGWKLDDRSWQDVALKVYLVREFASYYYPISA